MIYLMRHGLDDERFIGGYSNNHLTNEGVRSVCQARDYIVNKDTSSIVRGMNVRLDVACVVTFVRTEKVKTAKCPVCGAPIKEDNQSDVCEFCHNTIVKENYGWLISKKKVTKQKVIHD